MFGDLSQMPVNEDIKENYVEKERKPSEVLMKVKNRFRGRQKDIGEDWNFSVTSELWQFQGMAEAWGVVWN